MSARRELAARCRFDEHLGAYALAEDEDFSYRLSRHGRVVYLPDMVVVHEKLGFRSFDSRDFGKLVVRNRAYLFRKNFPQTPALEAAVRPAAGDARRPPAAEPRVARGARRARGDARPRARAAALSVRVAFVSPFVIQGGAERYLSLLLEGLDRGVDRADHVSRRRAAGGRAARTRLSGRGAADRRRAGLAIARSALRLRRELRRLRPGRRARRRDQGRAGVDARARGDADPGRLAEVRLQPRRLARARRRARAAARSPPSAAR